MKNLSQLQKTITKQQKLVDTLSDYDNNEDSYQVLLDQQEYFMAKAILYNLKTVLETVSKTQKDYDFFKNN